MPAQLSSAAFKPWDVIAGHEQSLTPGSYGACSSFVGTMRDFNVGDNVTKLTLEHYPEMTQRFLDNILEQAISDWALTDAMLLHRHGDLLPGEPIVLIAAWAPHRKEAFEACRYMIEALKKDAPFWKKETTESGERWVHDAPSVSGNESGSE